MEVYMWEHKNYNYNINTTITRAMSKYNKIMTGPRLTTLDGNILNLIRSFSETKTKFFISNKELGEIMIADPSTVQRSIDRLIAVGLVQKEIIYVGSKPQRILTYQKDMVQKKLLDID
jgi:DNA-binding MarR family transcriptional regulator